MRTANKSQAFFHTGCVVMQHVGIPCEYSQSSLGLINAFVWACCCMLCGDQLLFNFINVYKMQMILSHDRPNSRPNRND